MLSSMALLLGMAFTGVLAQPATVIEKTGYAYDRSTGALVYVERHQRIVAGERSLAQLVRYENAGGELIASKRLDYRTDALLPDFLMTDFRSGYLEGLLRESGETLVFCREGHGAELERAALDAAGGLADAGFDQLVRAEWEALAAGEVIERPFLVPARQAFFAFAISKSRELERGGRRLMELELEPRNRLLRLFVEPIRLVYDEAERTLVEYEGISNLRDEALENYDVRIEFPREARQRRSRAVVRLQPIALPRDDQALQAMSVLSAN